MKINLFFTIFLLSFQLGTAQNYVVSTAAGNGIAGNVNGIATNCELNAPYGLASDNDSCIYFADLQNHSIKKLNINTNIVSVIAGTGAAGYVDGIGSIARFNGPNSVSYKNGFLYITEASGHKVRKLDLNNNNTVTTVAGSGIAGFQNGTVGNAKFNNPFSAYADNNGNVYVADYGNHCIRLVSNGQVTTFAGTPTSSGNTNGANLSAKFNKPRNIIGDSNGDLYVADLLNNMIRKISGGMVYTFSGSGAPSSIDGTANMGSYNLPSGISITNNGYFYVTDAGGYKLRKMDPTGAITTIAGNGTVGFIDGPGISAEFDGLGGVCYDIHGNIYIADANNNRIRKITVPENGVQSFNSVVFSVIVYPNPANENITLQSKKELGIVTICNSLGEVVYQNKTSAYTIQIDISQFASGIYILQAQNQHIKLIKE